MRLTLRTLLAYLDNILEPGDAQTFAKKIEESKAAGELMHRIREVTKKVRLGAPAVEGKGLGLDPNTVAEYLDNTMPADRVADFELVCLESDVHLAEVAACHEILSLVLVKAADIDPQTRQRMYTLPAEPQASHGQAAHGQAAMRAEPVPQTAVPVAAPIASPAGGATAIEPARRFVVPDYLKQDDVPASTGGGGRIVVAICAVAALVLVGTALAMALAPHDKLPGFMRPMAEKLFPGNAPVAKQPSPDDTSTGGPSTGGPTADSSVSGAGAAGTSGDSMATGGGRISSIGPPAFGSATPPAATAPAVPGAVSTVDGAVGPGGLRQPASALAPAAAAMTATPTGTAPVPPSPGEIAPPSAPAAGTAPAPAMSATGTATGVPPAVPAATQPAKVEPVGRISSAIDQVLLRYDPAANAWVRLQGRETLMVGDRLLSLPGYRPQLSLNSGVTVDLPGGTLVELSPVDPMGTCGIRILRGRLLAFNAGGTKAKLAIDDGKLRGVCTLGSAELGFEHVFRRPPGVDPAAAEVPWYLSLYVKSGDVSWAAGGGPETALPPTTTWTVSETTPPVQLAGAVLPTWLVQDERDPLERQAADFIEMNLRGPKAITVVLKETLTDRRIENVQLALQCLAEMGDYEDFGPLLRDPTQRYSTWERHLRLLTSALDYGPFYAGRVRDAFAKQHGPELGNELYRMLWSFDDAQLAAGAAKELVETLDHPELDFRVVAYYTLVDITGLPLAYTPQDTPTKRKQAAQKWEQKLQMGQIVHPKP